MQMLHAQYIFAHRRSISHPRLKLTDCRKIKIHHNFLRLQAYNMRAERMHSKYKGRYAHTYDVVVNILSHDHWHHLNVLTFTDQAKCRTTRKKIERTTQRSQWSPLLTSNICFLWSLKYALMAKIYHSTIFSASVGTWAKMGRMPPVYGKKIWCLQEIH